MAGEGRRLGSSVMSMALRLSGVGLVRDDVTILDGVDWEVAPHERWIVLGPNGSGKTTLMRVAGLYLHPSRGEVEVLGERLGRVDVRRLRTRIGFVSAAFAAMLRDGVTAADVVMTAEHAPSSRGGTPTATATGAAPSSCSTAWVPDRSPTGRSAPFPRANGSGSSWPARCGATPGSCCSTSRPRASTSAPARTW